MVRKYLLDHVGDESCRALCAFSSWLYEDGYTDTNVLRAAQATEDPAECREVLSDTEIERLLTVFHRNDP